ncbi:MAG TPA: hypothetical protein VGW39_02260 [Chthoniobacterales bacterium]|nr:hypothetical protein [Chthoniobacterales bacterium]
MPKQRDRVATGKKGGLPRCLSASELLEVEAQSLSNMVKLRWPAALSGWQWKLAKAMNEAKSNASLNTHLRFKAPNPRAKSNTEYHEIDLGAQIALGGTPLVTYFVAIGEKDQTETLKLRRKIHFDLQKTFDSAEPKPMLHLQLGGGISEPLLAEGYIMADFAHLYPDLEKPRISCLPQSFALLIHQALLEYHRTEPNIETFVKSSGWLSVVTAAEGAVMKPYFDHGSDWLGSAGTKKRSLISRFYGV